MKTITFLAPLVTLTYAETEYCSNGLLSDDQSCDEESDGLRHIGQSRNMIALINCPEDANSANPVCKGRKDVNGKKRTYDQLLLQSLKNYGCNCFSINKKVAHPMSGKPHWLPGSNGEPVDEFDAHCKIMSKRYTCMKLDFYGMDLHHVLENRRVCDFFQGYSFTHDSQTGEIVCGPASNPNYANTNNGKMPKAIYNMNQCRLARCEMDLELARAVAPLFVDPVEFMLGNESNYGISGDYSVCSFAVNGDGADDCCGFPEARNPFSTLSKRCCDNSIVAIGSYEEDLLC